MLLFENLCTMNWYGRQAGAGPALSPFKIYIYNLLKDAPNPVRYYRYITYLKTPLGTYLFGILCLLVNCFLNILFVIGKWVGYLYTSYNNTTCFILCSRHNHFNIGEPWYTRFLGSCSRQMVLLRHYGLLSENLGLITYHGIRGFLVRCSR